MQTAKTAKAGFMQITMHFVKFPVHDLKVQ
jgi:hypothetical protein